MSPRGYLLVLGASVAGVLLTAFGISLAVDPFGISPFAKTIPGLNVIRVARNQNDRLIKRYDPLARPAEVIYMGSSRVKQGIDPDVARTRMGMSVYNAGVDDQTMLEKAALAAHYIERVPGLKAIYIELLVNLRSEAVRATISDTTAEEHASAIMRMFVSGSAQKASLNTLYLNAAYPHRRGASKPEATQPPRFTQLSGYLQAGRHPCPQCAFDAFADGQWLALNFDSAEDELVPLLGEIRERARTKGIEVFYFLSPMHAQFLYASEITGCWSSLETTKRRLASLGGVYDFTRYNALITEDPAVGMRYWSEAWHFTPELGELMVQVTSGARSTGLPRNFGRLLDPATIESDLAAFRAERDHWIARHPDVVKRYQAAAAKNGKRLRRCARVP